MQCSKEYKVLILSFQFHLNYQIFVINILLFLYCYQITYFYVFPLFITVISIYKQLFSVLTTFIQQDASKTLKTIHNSEIVVADLSFDNIIFDKNFNHYYIDFENCALNNISHETVPGITFCYLQYRGCEYEIDYNYDRLSMILCTIYSLIGTELECIEQYDYDKLAEQYKTLKELRKVFLALKKQYKKVPELPYIDEFINFENEHKIPKMLSRFK